MNIPENLKYSADHEWLKVDGDVAYVGITAHAANELGDIVFLDITSVGETLDKDVDFGTNEAVKTVADLMLPVGGEVLEFNEALEDNPALMRKDPGYRANLESLPEVERMQLLYGNLEELVPS